MPDKIMAFYIFILRNGDEYLEYISEYYVLKYNSVHIVRSFDSNHSGNQRHWSRQRNPWEPV